MAIPKTPKPPVSSVAVVSGVGGAVVASAASGAVVRGLAPASWSETKSASALMWLCPQAQARNPVPLRVARVHDREPRTSWSARRR